MLSNHPSVLGSGPASVTTSAATSAALDLISSTQGAVLYRNATVWTALTPGTSGQLLSTQGAAANPIWVTATGGAGDFNGPASSTDNAIVRFDGTGGKTGQNSAITVGDAGSNLVLLSSPSTNNLQLQGSGTAATGFVQFLNTTAATNTTSGAVQIGANIGLSGNSGGPSYFGGNLNVAGIAGIGASTTTGISLSQGGDPGTFTFSAANAWVGGRFAPERAATTGNAFAVSGQIRLASGTQTRGATFIADAPNGTVTNHTYFYANGAGDRVAPAGSYAFYSDAAAGTVNIAATTSASSSTVGALTVGNGTAATNVAIGGGNINAGGTLTVGGATAAFTGSVTSGAQIKATSGGLKSENTGADGLLTLTRVSVNDWNFKGGTNLTVDAGGAALTTLTSGGNFTATGVITGASLATGQTPSASVATASTHKVAIVLGGVTYYILLTNVP